MNQLLTRRSLWTEGVDDAFLFLEDGVEKRQRLEDFDEDASAGGAVAALYLVGKHVQVVVVQDVYLRLVSQTLAL